MYSTKTSKKPQTRKDETYRELRRERHGEHKLKSLQPMLVRGAR